MLLLNFSDFTEPHLTQCGPDFWLGPLAAFMLPLINKKQSVFVLQQQSWQAWSEADALSKNYFISYYHLPGSPSLPIILVYSCQG